MNQLHQFHAHDLENLEAHTHDDINIANHKECSHNHVFKQVKDTSKKKLTIIMCMTLLFTIIEFAGAIWSGSLALLSDSFHMLTDSGAILLALFMANLSQKPANPHYSYGHGRSETIGALLNGIFMIGIVIYLLFQAVDRILKPEAVNSVGLISIAFCGLLVNMIAVYILHDAKSLNTKAALVHVIGDLLGSIAAIVAGIVIYFTNYTIIDPILSILVSLIIAIPAYKIIKKSMHILMEGVPENINYLEVGNSINDISGVVSVHDLHIWNMASDHTCLSAHILINDTTRWNEILVDIQSQLSNKYNIHHVTLQPELEKIPLQSH